MIQKTLYLSRLLACVGELPLCENVVHCRVKVRNDGRFLVYLPHDASHLMKGVSREETLTSLP